MATGETKTTDLDEYTGSLSGAEWVHVVVGGVSKKVLTQKIISPVTFCELFQIDVINNSGGDLTPLTVAYPDGVLTDKMTIAKANAGAYLTSRVIGITKETVTNGSSTDLVYRGQIENVDTSALSVGLVYLDPATAGGLTNTRPTAAGVYSVAVGYCINSNATTGKLFVFGFENVPAGQDATTVSIPANTSSHVIILGADTIKGFNVSFLATRGSRYRKESIEILVGATGYLSAGALILPNGETETGGLSISHDTSGGNARLLITTDNADATATTFTYYLKSF